MGRDLHLTGLGSDSLPCRVMGFSVWEPHDEREVLETFFWLWYGGMIEQQGLSSNLPVPEGQAVCTKGL